MSLFPLPEARWPDEASAREALLFRPLRVGSLQVHRRTWVPAMVPWRATNEGFVTEENLDWYGRFAEGRPGVLVAEATGIRDIPSGPLLRLGHDRFVEGMTHLAKRVHEASEGQTKFLIQLIDFLRVNRRPDAKKFFQRYFTPTSSHRHRLAEVTRRSAWRDATDDELRLHLSKAPPGVWASVLTQAEYASLSMGYRESVNDTHLAHIRDLPATLPSLFADAAARAQAAGFDGIELHFAHAYTMASFLSRTNVRHDNYGGSRAARLRLPLEIIDAVRDRVGSDYCVGARFLADEVIEGGSRIDDAAHYGVAFAKAGLDFLSLSKGGRFEDARQPRVGHAVYPYTGPSGHECMPTTRIAAPGPFGRNLPLAKAVRDAVRAAGYETPVVAAGGFCTFEQAETALQEASADLIAAARQSLADPDWFLKMELGRGAEIRRCTYTNYCEGLDQAHKQVTCKLWDKLWRHDPAQPTESAPPPGVSLSTDGRRQLLPPAWNPGQSTNHP